MNLFDNDNYRNIIRNWVKSQPSKGRGQLLEMAELIGTPASVFSQILGGQRDLLPDHAFLLADHMGLLSLEKEYFITLVQIEKASHHQYKKFLKEKKEQLKSESLNLSKRVPHEKILDEKEQQEFYSTWLYSAIRLSCGIGNGFSAEEIKRKFHLSQQRTIHMLDFLVRTGLIIQKEGAYHMGPQRTFLARNSPMIGRHHSNWRIKAIERANDLAENELMFTGPLTCSQRDAAQIREKLAKLIQEISDIVKDSPSEELIYFGLDFLQIASE